MCVRHNDVDEIPCPMSGKTSGNINFSSTSDAAFITFQWFAVYLLEYCYSEMLAYRISYTNLIYNFVVNRLTKSIIFQDALPIFSLIFLDLSKVYFD